jgi:alkylhydroperoxidase family enzyme
MGSVETCAVRLHIIHQDVSEEQLLELGAQIAFENYRARLNCVFDVESDELYAPS